MRGYLLLVCVVLLSCNANPTQSETSELPAESVMPVGSTLLVQTSVGPLSMTAITKNTRVLKIGNDSWTFELAPRPQRWYGSLGLYLPGAGILQNLNIPLQEYQAHHSSLKALEKDLEGLGEGELNDKVKKSLPPPLYHLNNTGLEVYAQVRQISRDGNISDLDLEVIQHCINGRKPTHLRGAQNDVYLRDKHGEKVDSLPCRRVGRDADIDAWSRNHPEQS